MPRASCSLKATAVTALWASSDFAPSGVYDYGTLEEDGPETWEALISPWADSGHLGEPVTRLRRAACLREAHAAGHRVWHRTSTRHKVGRRQGKTVAAADGNEGVGGLHTSYEVGERAGTGPGGAKAARVDVIFRMDP